MWKNFTQQAPSRLKKVLIDLIWHGQDTNYELVNNRSWIPHGKFWSVNLDQFLTILRSFKVLGHLKIFGCFSTWVLSKLLLSATRYNKLTFGSKKPSRWVEITRPTSNKTFFNINRASFWPSKYTKSVIQLKIFEKAFKCLTRFGKVYKWTLL